MHKLITAMLIRPRTRTHTQDVGIAAAAQGVDVDNDEAPLLDKAKTRTKKIIDRPNRDTLKLRIETRTSAKQKNYRSGDPSSKTKHLPWPRTTAF